ncbi:MAG TPA: hypothetical protein VK689_14935, partial [Armatimonadota bacterium]|nr:hypothetical protein [Armatimonadota bacterium]
MRRISRLIAGLCVLGSAACASDGILAPQIAPASEPLAAAAVASGPIADEDPKALVSSAPSVVIRCGGTIRS